VNPIDLGFNLDYSYSKLPSVFYTEIEPNPVTSPKLIIINNSLGESLGLNMDSLRSEDGIDILAGNKVVEGDTLLAQAYAGHQFGHFTMLGDGRGLLIGEQITPKGERFDIQLKGSGRTPYSRGGDGRAGLGPMLREYIISEAIYYLGIPTTRSLAVVETGDKIIRETKLPGAILTRVAKSHIRVGTFEYASQWGTVDDLKILADYTIKRHFSYVEEDGNPYLSLLKEVIRVQAELISKWQLVGFIHGVMNTDNMSISGETIDYGPCAFMNNYDPSTVFSSIDRHGRYAYGNQPDIGGWNLARFAETLLPLIHRDKEGAISLAQDALNEYIPLYYHNWTMGMRSKLGIFNEEVEDETLIEELLELMKNHKADYTNAFIALTTDKLEGEDLFKSEEFKKWYSTWELRLNNQAESRESSKELMKKSNPSVIPRNHQVERALDSAVKKGDYTVIEDLLKALSNPYNYSNLNEKYMSPPEPSFTPYETFCGT
jgi:uncharacterized protein YdiU (UPF0061 family)